LSQLVWNEKINYLTLTSFMILHKKRAGASAPTS
jgi:hypothetical protein